MFVDGATAPIALPPYSVNQSRLSDPAAISYGPGLYEPSGPLSAGCTP